MTWKEICVLSPECSRHVSFQHPRRAFWLDRRFGLASRAFLSEETSYLAPRWQSSPSDIGGVSFFFAVLKIAT